MSSRPDLGPKPHLGYAASPIDRAAERRADAAGLAALEQDLRSGAYAMSGETVALKKTANGHDPLFTVAEARALGATEQVFLGLAGGAGRFGFALAPSEIDALKQRGDLVLADLRTLAVHGLVAPDHLGPIAEAKALLSWHARHGFCPNCGKPTQVVEAGWRRDCPACATQHFPRTDPVVIMLTIDGENCLLGRSARFPGTMWSCLAGFVEPGETIEEAVRRETLEEAGIVCGQITYFASQPWPFPSSLMIGCHARAVSRDIVVDKAELEDARWFSRDEAALMLVRQHPDKLGVPPPIAIAHHIIRRWVEDDVEFDEHP
jgi:NAD+ diphosphatase